MGFTVRTLHHHGVGVAVDDEVETGDIGIEVGGAVGADSLVHAEVGEADNDVRARLRAARQSAPARRHRAPSQRRRTGPA